MKKKILALLFSVAVFSACEDEQMELGETSAVEFDGKTALIRAEDLSNLRFRNLPGTVTLDTNTPEGQIKVEGSEDLSKWLEAKYEGGELRLEGKGKLPTSIDLNYHIHPHDIARIVVEGDRRVEILSTPVLDRLELVTEGESELIVHDLKARHLKSRREGKSRMYLSNELLDFRHEKVFFLAKDVEVLDSRFVLYKENNLDYLLWSPEVQVRSDTVFALAQGGTPLRAFFLTHTHEMVNQGESYLDAFGLPTLVVTSRNEGESEARVWAVQQLNVKGEGESVMYYFGFPVVNKELKGASQLVHWP